MADMDAGAREQTRAASLGARALERLSGWGAEMSARTLTQAQATLSEAPRARQGWFRLRAVLPFLGPAFIAAVAYVDPGNFATNIQAGAAYGYTLLWVILLANLVAILVQTLSAKVGIATGRNLPQLAHDHLPQWLSVALWIIAEIAAMATDLAEFLGAAIGFNLLLHVPLLVAALMTGAATFGILGLQRLGFRPLEAVIGLLIGVIAVSYLVEAVMARPNLGQVAYHIAVPQFGGAGGWVLAVGIFGATVMPHVVYLHSALTQDRIPARSASDKRRIFAFERLDIWLALGIAGLVNGAMLLLAASVFNATGHMGVASIETAYQTLTPLLGNASSWLFAVALLASGLSSSTVGTMAGQVIMEGFLGWKVPVWVRRLVTMAPAIVVIALGVNPTNTLVLSQVALSFALPFAVTPLVYFTSRRDIMGELVNARWTRWLSWSVAGLIVVLNIGLLAQTFGWL